MARWLFTILWVCTSLASSAQTDSTASTPLLQQQKPHSPARATTLSLVPGLGQAYNKKYWKVPVVWGAMGAAGYNYYSINRNFNNYEQVLQLMIDNPTVNTSTDIIALNPSLFDKLPLPLYGSTRSAMANETMTYMDKYRNDREMAVVLILGVYALNLLDANIDAHLFTFDVSDDLSIRPTLVSPMYTSMAPGLKLTLNLP